MEEIVEEKAPGGAVGEGKPPKKRKPSAKREVGEGKGRGGHHNQEVGTKGEEAAVSFLKSRGYCIRDRNWKCLGGEVDIVAEDEEALVFIEVKTRESCEYGFPEEAVDLKKRKRYEKIAGFYLQDHEVDDKCVRFDVVSILVVAPQRAFLRHHKNAFLASE
ncbi:MAG: YraN family protein [Eggerthellaceae bacterium]|nr:YraN family protein [Eggerthellaceae bacterium]